MKSLIIILLFYFLFFSSCGEKPRTDGSVVTISLPKKQYKVHEPILLKYEWINYKDTPDSIWAVFSRPPHIKQFISDDNGNKYQQELRSRSDMLYILNQVLYKNDTLIKSVHINPYGLSSWDASIFGSNAMLPIGKYEMFSVIIEDANGRSINPPITTNKIKFEIIQYDRDEVKILELAEKKQFAVALSVNPNTYFAEPLKYWALLDNFQKYKYALAYNKEYGDTIKLGEQYLKFFSEYPNSLFYFQHDILIQYLKFVSSDSTSAHKEIDNLMHQYPNTILSTELKQFMKMEKLFGRSLIWMKQ